jgi:hypothetical protein
VGPYQTSPVVVDDDNQVLVPLLVGGLIDPDAPCTLEAPLAARGLQVGADAGADLADGVSPRRRWPDPRAARHTTQSLKSRVKRDLGLAQGIASTRTPCSGQATHLVAYSRKHVDRARSIALHDRGLGDLS